VKESISLKSWTCLSPKNRKHLLFGLRVCVFVLDKNRKGKSHPDRDTILKPELGHLILILGILLN
jgi:hypothetical protein